MSRVCTHRHTGTIAQRSSDHAHQIGCRAPEFPGDLLWINMVEMADEGRVT